MTVLEKAPELNVHSYNNTGLIVDPTDITFDDLTSDTVMIRVKIRNEGEYRSSPTSVRLESAPFGAFVAWRPLATLPVPALEPGESRELSVTATRPHPVPLGGLDRVPPMSVLTALGASSDTPLPQRDVGRAVLQGLFRRQGISRPASNAKNPWGLMLPPDLWEFFGREQPHWAGNINVFVGDCAVERHVAKALRIYSGRTNLAMFVVGGRGKRDAYAFKLVGLAPDWKAALHNVTGAKTLVVRSMDKPIQEKQWVPADTGMMLMMLAVQPPKICKNGRVQVQVTRQSCQKTAVVEFNLDPMAQGPGCYVV
ncbi:MAG TPA: hypothetical protein VMH87_02965 [Pseudomonadales bacterium]|nr:hypothetical protein [Pseudomonadales bacterium]